MWKCLWKELDEVCVIAAAFIECFEYENKESPAETWQRGESRFFERVANDSNLLRVPFSRNRCKAENVLTYTKLWIFHLENDEIKNKATRTKVNSLAIADSTFDFISFSWCVINDEQEWYKNGFFEPRDFVDSISTVLQCSRRKCSNMPRERVHLIKMH